MLRQSAREFAESEILPHVMKFDEAQEFPVEIVRKMAEDEKGYTPEIWLKMAELGWIGLLFPERYGGVGGSFLDLAVLLYEMGYACLPGPFFSTAVLGAIALLEAGLGPKKAATLKERGLSLAGRRVPRAVLPSLRHCPC